MRRQENLGQYFTPDYIVDMMLKLRKNAGNILEPSCGDGSFYSKIENCVGIELDKTVAPAGAVIKDFMAYPIKNKFDTIIGNPPYVKFQNIMDSTKEKLDMDLFDERSNLYLFFMYKSILHLKEHGEIIFIVPRDFLKSTSAMKLNQFAYDNGTITDFIDLGDKRIFRGATPNCVIFRYEKDNFSRKTNNDLTYSCINGQVVFIKDNYTVKFSDLFFVKVGAASGADACFESENGNTDFVFSQTRKTGKTKKMFYDTYNPELDKYKEKLISRKIKKFSEDDWYMWGRRYYESDANRIYVNQKTRMKDPFFFNSCKAYDGSVLAIFPKFETTEEICKTVADELNTVNWSDLGFVCDGRFLFTQKALENTVLPDEFLKYIK